LPGSDFLRDELGFRLKVFLNYAFKLFFYGFSGMYVLSPQLDGLESVEIAEIRGDIVEKLDFGVILNK
jgi:hypothetical protein